MTKLSVNQTLLRANSLARKGQVEEARRLCQAVIEAYPNNKRAKAALADLKSASSGVPGQTPPQELLERLGSLLSQGKSAVAAAEAERLSKSYPNALVVWNLLGAASAEAGQNETAEGAFRRAIALSPGQPKSYRNLGKVLINMGKFEEAAEACRRALQIRGDYLEAFNTLGNALKASGRHEEAVAAYLRALKIQPNYVEVLYNLGNTLLEMGKADKAAQVYEKVLKLQPDLAGGIRGLALSLLSLGRADEAISICKDVVKTTPDNAAAHLLLADALRQDGQTDAALVAVHAALELAPGDAEARNDLGITLQANDQIDDAVTAFRAALEIQPDYVQARKNLGVALLSKGATQEALTAYETVLQVAPEDVEAHRHLSIIKTYSADDPHIAGMIALLARENLADADRCQLCFALAKASEDQGGIEQSLAYLREGNTLRKAQLGYDIAGDQAQFAAFRDAAADLRAASLPPGAEPATVTPVFILGMPRSGTTLVEHIVSAHSNVTGAGELALVERHGNALATGQIRATAEQLQAFRDAYLDGISKRSGGKSYVTDKMPLNFRYIALICAALPEAKIIHVERDPAATCWSNFRQYFENRNLGFCHDLGDTVAYFGLYQDLMGVWASEYGPSIHDFDYEALAEEQERLTRELIAYLNLEYEDACLSPEMNARAVATASQQQVRRAVYGGSSYAWRKYEPYLDGALDALGA